MSTNCSIQANPDIAGIGVRVSIYIQALLALFPAAVALYQYGITHATVSNFGVVGEPVAIAEYERQSHLWRTDPSAAIQRLRDLYEPVEDEEREDLRQTWMPVQVTGVALLVSGIIQAKLYGLSLYHALIVINLSWLNNMTALGLALTDLFLANPIDFFFGAKRHPKQLIPYLICGFHLTGTAAFGLWVFNNLDTFGSNPECNPYIHYWVFGRQVSATAAGFRKAGLIISGLAICPGLNLSLEMLFSAIVGFLFSIPGLLLHIVVVSILMFILVMVMKYCIPMDKRDGLRKFMKNLPIHSPARKVFSQAMPYAFMVMIFIIATEELIRINRDLVSDGESDWTFGQTLAMFVLLPVVLDVWSKLRRAWNLEIKRKAEMFPEPSPDAHEMADLEEGEGENGDSASKRESAAQEVAPSSD